MNGKLVALIISLAIVAIGCSSTDGTAATGTKPRTDATEPGVASSTTVALSTTATPGTKAPRAAVPAFPRVYRGEGLYRLTIYRSGDDATFVCEESSDMELRLEADGTAVFTYFTGIGVNLSGDGAECNEIAGNAWTGSYDAVAGTFAIDLPSDALDLWDVGGSFDDESAHGPASYEYATEIGDNFLRDTIVITFDLPLVP